MRVNSNFTKAEELQAKVARLLEGHHEQLVCSLLGPAGIRNDLSNRQHIVTQQRQWLFQTTP